MIVTIITLMIILSGTSSTWTIRSYNIRWITGRGNQTRNIQHKIAKYADREGRKYRRQRKC